MAKRLAKEKKQLEDDPLDNATAGPDDESNILAWTAMIMGPEDTPYDGGVFNVSMVFPPEYPFKPPKVQFTTKIYHPNIKSTGEICMDAVNDNWSPTCNVKYLLNVLSELIKNPNAEDGLEAEIAAQMKSDMPAFEAEAKRQTEAYAQ